MASQQQGVSYVAPPITVNVTSPGVPYNVTYRSYLNNGIKIGACMLGANIVPCLCCFGFVQIIGGIIAISTSTSGPFGASTGGIVIGSILLVIGSLLMTGGITLGCIAYKSYKNTRLANPGLPINPTTGAAFLQGSSMPNSSDGISAYSSVNTQGAGFSSQYNYSPSPGFSGQSGGASYPSPPPGYSEGQPGGSSYPPPQPGFSGQPGGSSYPPPTPGLPEKPGIDPPPYEASIPSAPNM